MTIRQAPRVKVTQRLLGAMTALVLGAWVFPSLAATGTDNRSDPAMDAPLMPLTTGRELSIRTIDPVAASDVDPESLPLDDAPAETPVDAAGPHAGTQFGITLRRILDKAQAREPRLQQSRENDGFNAPLAVDKSETLEDTPLVLEADPSETAAEFPGFGANDVLRYRRQMYRTDI